MSSLKTVELKFLLKLLGCEGYRGKIRDLTPNSKTSASERDRICKTLSEKGLVEYDSEILCFTITPPGRVLLTLDTTSLPVTPDELKLLKACKGSMTLEKLGSRVPPGYGQQLVSNLVSRKLLKVSKCTITEVRLTLKGRQVLQDAYECNTFLEECGSAVGRSIKL